MIQHSRVKGKCGTFVGLPGCHVEYSNVSNTLKKNNLSTEVYIAHGYFMFSPTINTITSYSQKQSILNTQGSHVYCTFFFWVSSENYLHLHNRFCIKHLSLCDE